MSINQSLAPSAVASATQEATQNRELKAIVGEPEVVEDGRTGADGVDISLAKGAEDTSAWRDIKAAATAISHVQAKDGSIPDRSEHENACAELARLIAGVEALAPMFPWDQRYLEALVVDLRRWMNDGFGVPDFLDSLVEFHPEKCRVDGLRHLVIFPMYTQNGSSQRHLEAVLVEVIWPEFMDDVQRDYENQLFVSLRFVDFTAGYDTNSAVLFPETVAMRSIPAFTWGAIFQDREAARYRRVIAAAAEMTKLELPPRAQAMLHDQVSAEKSFILWDVLHDRTHMRGDLPFDPFMIKQRMPYFLYSLEELRCDLTAFRDCVDIEKKLRAKRDAGAQLSDADTDLLEHAGQAQYAVILDRIFRFALSGTRVRNYDGLGGQLLFAWLHQRGVLQWRDVALAIDWEAATGAVLALGEQIDELYWRSIDRPKSAHWLAAYELVSSTLTPHPASSWAKGLPTEILSGPMKGYTDAVLDDEFPLSMFYEALGVKLGPVIESTAGMTGAS